MSTIQNFRSFLKRNEIFFDTVSTASLAIIALFISCMSYKTSNRQSELTELSNQPLFIWYNSGNGLALKNDGAIAGNIDCYFEYIIEATLEPPHGNHARMTQRRYIVSESDYYPSGKTSGEIYVFSTDQLRSLEMMLQQSFTEGLRSAGCDEKSGRLEIKQVAVVDYVDIYGIDRRQYFQLDPIKGYPRLSNPEGRRLLRSIESMEFFGLDSDSTTTVMASEVCIGKETDRPDAYWTDPLIKL